MFTVGIAYPIDAKIKENKEGDLIRYCNFNTGSFVEPITEIQPPHLLRFSVLEQPPSMHELSPYHIHPPHLTDYLVSTQGQFKLQELSPDSTLIEGTTWYYIQFQPGFYWRIWSDFIIHKIHHRVLNHIKIASEDSRERQF